jgi:hypothetical protein
MYLLDYVTNIHLYSVRKSRICLMLLIIGLLSITLVIPSDFLQGKMMIQNHISLFAIVLGDFYFLSVLILIIITK